MTMVCQKSVLSFDSLSSNSMKSKNPLSGCRQVELAKCLDTSNGCPSKNQGGLAVVAIAGNIIGRAPKNGGNHNGFDESGACYTLTTNDRHAVAFKIRGGCDGGGKGYLGSEQRAFTLSTVQDQNIFQSPCNVRRLTPKEAERLQGFTDDFTKVPYRNKPADQCPNGVRYKALGNSMAVNVMAWIGQRVQQATAIKVYGVNR